MAENYKLLYEQMKKIVTTYQDEVVPGLREIIKDLEQNQIKVRCKDCKNYMEYPLNKVDKRMCCYVHLLTPHFTPEDGFCSYGERRSEDDHHRTE
jgi:hypothetical protein